MTGFCVFIIVMTLIIIIIFNPPRKIESQDDKVPDIKPVLKSFKRIHMFITLSEDKHDHDYALGMINRFIMNYQFHPDVSALADLLIDTLNLKMYKKL